MKTATVFERFESVVARQPTLSAFKDSNSEYSYSELHLKAIAVRSYISQLEYTQPGLIALFLKDRYKSVVAMIGVTGSMHAYVPLDPDDADERLSLTFKDSGAFAIIVEDADIETAKRLFPNATHIINCDKLPIGTPVTQVSYLPKPDQLIYTLYTSGSTGKPKGVCQNHSNLLFYIDTYIAKLSINPNDRVSWLYNYNVSASNMDIYGALLSGATLCSYDTRKNGLSGLSVWLNDNRVTLLHTAPTVLRELIRTLLPDSFFPYIRTVDLAGEALYLEDITNLTPHIPTESNIFNRLAATEICFIAHHKIDLNNSLNMHILPVGKCPDEVKVEIILSDGQIAPINEVGLINIHSQFICPGYLNQPDLNDSTFSVSQINPNWRQYKSSDLGKIDQLGNLHYIGREGSRVKLRGHSIDLSEIEAALLSCDGVNEAVVISNANAEKEAQELLAFISITHGKVIDLTTLRKQLFKLIPTFMLPSGYVFFEILPRTSSGKVDRQALKNLDYQENKYRPDYREPIDEVEQRVAAIFSAVLQFEPIGRFDDFFLMGGDSLNLVDLQLMFRNEFGCEINDIHENSTVEAIAVQIRLIRKNNYAGMPILLPIQVKGTAPALFLVHGRRGQAHVGKNFTDILGNNQPFYTLQARGLDGLTAPNLTINDMASDYVDAIIKLQSTGPYFIGGLCAGGYIAIEMARKLRNRGAEVLPLLLIDPPPPRFNKNGDQLLETGLIARINRRVTNGDWEIDTNNNQTIKAAIDVARAFESALMNYKVHDSYDGPVFLISSKARLTTQQWFSKEALYYKFNRFLSALRLLPSNRRVKKKWTKRELSQVFGEKLTVFSVDGKHKQLLNANNIQFKDQLTKCKHLIQHWPH
ncbi:MAG: AMP-binding protein [Methylotenera sp.]|uniref:non-ribosomal peptide synthetase n=1 Tax=Methylotenera sp. TaxID=2051956 RepID=UPI00271F61CF|nr:AMP-binding protein [Methylotenera sp.]MDO9150505.1 AMP-binding protein [Methylotenera sp.]